jgi:hypothetical protein
MVDRVHSKIAAFPEAEISYNETDKKYCLRAYHQLHH